MLTHKRLSEVLDYEPKTGWFINRYSRGKAIIGCRAGTVAFNGYRKIVIDGIEYAEHHLAWLYVYGYLPKQIDHRDGVKSNNAIENLRECDSTQNKFNRAYGTGISGLKGVSLDRRTLKWRSRIQVRGQQILLGVYDTPEEAHAVYLEAAEECAGEFAFHNREPQPLTMEAI